MAKNQGSRKSPVDETVLETLVRELTRELPFVCQAILRRDLQALRERSAREGLGFLTKTLPSVAEAMDESFSSGLYSLSPDFGFTLKKGWKTPAFMQCFFARVYFPDGRLRDDADPYAVYAIRQVAYLYKKIERPVGPWCGPAIASFKERAVAKRPCPMKTDLRLTAARRLMADIFSDFTVDDIKGKHGPGVVADRIPNDLRWDTLTWPEGADWLWPKMEHFVPLLAGAHDITSRIGTGGNKPSRLICVPKTSKTPRLIAAEPAGLQFLQGGMAEKLVTHLEKHWLTRGHVNFRDQTINQRLAREGSIDGTYVTIDLSDASDTLGHELVQDLFPTKVGVALDLLRCEEIDVEGHKIRPTFFASMGSALTFPVESISFFCVVVGAIMAHDRRYRFGLDTEDNSASVNGPLPDHHRRAYYAGARKHVYVYGDDIIVHRDHASCVLDALRDFGFKPNLRKSYVTGPFRESCGKDWFRGTDVRPLYLRKYTPSTRSDINRVVSGLEAANQFADQGLSDTARAIYKTLGRQFPAGDAGSPYLSQRLDGFTPKSRRDRNIHCVSRLVPVLKKPVRKVRTSECGRYLSALMGRETAQSSFRNDRQDRSYIKLLWVRD